MNKRGNLHYTLPVLRSPAVRDEGWIRYASGQGQLFMDDTLPRLTEKWKHLKKLCFPGRV